MKTKAKFGEHLTLGTIFLLLSTSLFGFSCTSSKKNQPLTAPPPPSREIRVQPTAPPLKMSDSSHSSGSQSGPLLAHPLTVNGQNTDASFSPDGLRVIFISRLRSAHVHAQIYELDMEKKTEKRVTFHDGDAASPEYFPDGETILYASSTDEIKEDPTSIERLKERYLKASQTDSTSLMPMELYKANLNGRDIKRLTNTKGYDAEASLDTDGKLILFTSARTGSSNLYLMSGARVSALTKGTTIDRSSDFSPDSKFIVWSRQESPESQNTATGARIYLADSAMRSVSPLTPEGAFDQHPKFHPLGEEIIFSSNRGGQFFNLYTIDRSGQCLKRLTNVSFDQLQPSFSPDGRRILFTGNVHGEHQIYVMDFRPPADCLPAPKG